MANQRPARRLEVFVDGLPAPQLKPLEIERSRSAVRRDHAVLQFHFGAKCSTPGAVPEHLVDYAFFEPRLADLTSLNGAEVEIVDPATNQVFHWGRLSIQEATVGDEEGDDLQLVSAIGASDLGIGILGMRVVDVTSKSATWTDSVGRRRGVYLDGPVVFNPEFRGVLHGNLRTAPSHLPSGAGGVNYPVFIDPRSVESSAAATFQQTGYRPVTDPTVVQQTASDTWDLARAAHHLCEELNGKATWQEYRLRDPFIENPTLDELQAVLPDDRRILKNVRIPGGTTLGPALDLLLEPLGFGWEITLPARGRRKIRVFPLGRGDAVNVLCQRPGAQLDTDKTDAVKFRLNWDLSRAINQVRASGGLTRIEFTAALQRAWPPAHDTLTAAEEENVIRGTEEWEAHPEFHRSWRDWVLNEAGDYPHLTAFDFSPLFEAAFGGDHPPVVHRRRELLPTLTLGDDNSPIGRTGGVLVEWFNPQKEGGAGYEPIPEGDAEWACRLLKNECGIRFAGENIPWELYEAGSQAQIRVTATVESDHAIAETARSVAGFQRETAELHVERPGGFQFRQRLASGPYRSIFAVVDDAFPGPAAVQPAQEADGRLALKEFAQRLVRALDVAECSGNVPVDGIDRDRYAIGAVVEKIEGREIDLTVGPGDLLSQQYPQITGLRFYPEEQKTVLILESFRDTDTLLATLIRDVAEVRLQRGGETA